MLSRIAPREWSIVVFLDGLDVGRNVDMGRTLVLAGRGILFYITKIGAAFLPTIYVGKKIIAEVFHRIKHRHCRTLAESTLAIFQKLRQDLQLCRGRPRLRFHR